MKRSSLGGLANKSSLARMIFILALLVLPFASPSSRLMNQIDESLVNFRFSSMQRPATGKVAYVTIDKRSLDEIGVWPWPRSVHAALIDQLIASGVGDIFVDVDFSTPSTPENDQRLAKALADAGGGVILPVFLQHESGEEDAQTVVTRPIPVLADNAWLAFANVAFDNRGEVRRFDLGGMLDGVQTQSVAAVLAQAPASDVTLPIDYSIDPTSVPTFSVSDILNGRVDKAALEGRSVVIGAYATELKDIFAVPVYGALSGPMLHVLGAETLLQKRMLVELYQAPLELLFAGFLALSIFLLRSRPSFYVVPGLFLMGVGVEASAFALQEYAVIMVHTAVIWVSILLGLVFFLSEKVDLRSLLLEIANVQHRNTRNLLKRVVADSVDGVIAFNSELRVVEESASARTLLGVGGQAKTAQLADLLPADLLETLRGLVTDYHQAPGRAISCKVGFALQGADGVRHLEAAVTLSPLEKASSAESSERGSFIGSMIIRDMTARKLFEEKLQRLSQYDDLTGLLNRREFTERLNRLPGCCHIAVLDMHRFAVLNATMGRDMGDALLKAVAERLGDDPSISLLGRLGGDVFCVALESPTGLEAERYANQLLDHFNAPFDLGGSMVYAAARLGICTSPARNEDADTWIEDAEHALGEAKTVAGQGWRSYDPDVAIRQTRARKIEKEMSPGLTRDEYFLLYQPQVDLRTGRLIGAEALVRWQHPTMGLISPGEFIPVAESSGFICELGRWALMEGCREAATWPDHLTVAINVSPIQFAKSDVVGEVQLALASSGLSPKRLHLEITETAFVEGDARIHEIVGQLRDMGVSMALDDFGTGYSSLSYMAGFPLDKLKIDQSFVRKMVQDPRSLTIVQTIRMLASGLDLSIVAEGIESEVERDILNMMGCEVGQGYYFGKPMKATDLLKLVNQPTWSMPVAEAAQKPSRLSA